MQIPISKPEMYPETGERVLEVLASGQLAQGAVVTEAEAAFAEAIQVPHCAMVNNGTSALRAALAYEVAAGDEVIVPAFSFNATMNAALQLGAMVRLVDVNANDFNINSDAVASVITDRTKAIVPVHLYGQAADMDALTQAAPGRALVEDAAQAHGARYKGRSVGVLGSAAAFSFYPTKNIGCGEGGAVTSANIAVDDFVRVYRNQGMRARYHYEMIGDNLRMTNLHAAVLVPQIARLQEVNNRRRQNAQLLQEELKDIEGLILPTVLQEREHVWHQFTVRVSDGFGMSREALAESLQEQGVSTGVYYPKVMADHDCYRGNPRIIVEDIPVAQMLAEEALSLPVGPWVDETGIAYIGAAIRRAQASSGRRS